MFSEIGKRLGDRIIDLVDTNSADQGATKAALDINHELLEVVALGHVANHSHTDETSEDHFAPQPDPNSFAGSAHRAESGGPWI